MSQPILKTAHYILRAFVAEDAQDVQRLAGDEQVARTTLNIPHSYPDGLAERWIEDRQKKYRDGSNVTYAIVSQSEEQLIGAVAMTIFQKDHRAELGYWVGKTWWGQGVATEASSRLVRYGFEALNLNCNSSDQI